MPTRELINGTKTRFHFQRYEWKYIVPLTFADKIIPDLLHHMDWDPYVTDKKNGGYRVNSLYFDSDGYRSFFEKMNGHKKRKKLRLRYYGAEFNEEESVYVEIKRKFDAIIIKDRLKMDYALLKKILSSSSKWMEIKDFSHHEMKTIQEFLWTMTRFRMQPKLFVSYFRRPLLGKNNRNFRITLDSNIKTTLTSSLENLEKVRSIDYDKLIIEVKYNNILPHWFYQLIQKYQLNREPYSKYCNCLIGCLPHSHYIFDLNHE